MKMVEVKNVQDRDVYSTPFSLVFKGYVKTTSFVSLTFILRP